MLFTWTLWLAPPLVLLLIGATNESSIEVGSAVVAFVPFFMLGLVTQQIIVDGFAERFPRFPLNTFTSYPMVKIVKIAVLAGVTGFGIGTPIATGYVSGHTLGEEDWYLAFIIAVLILNYRNFLSGTVRADSRFIYISHFFHLSKVAKDDIEAIEIATSERPIPNSFVGFRVRNGTLMRIPRLEYFLCTPDQLESRRGMQQALDYLSVMILPD